MIFAQSQEGVIPWQLKMHSNFTRCSLRIHDQNMADAAAKRQRDAIAMVENTHQRNPFDDGGATFRLMNRDTTASAPQIMQFAIEDHAPNVSTRWHGPHHTIKLELDGTSHPNIASASLSFLLRDSLLFLLRLSPFRLTAPKRNALELMAQSFRTVALRVHHQLGQIVNSACEQRYRRLLPRLLLRLHRLNRLPVQMQALEELEGPNETLRALHRHPRRIEDGTRRSGRYLGAPQRKN